MSKSTRKRIPKARRCTACDGEGGFGSLIAANGTRIKSLVCDACGGSGRLKDRTARILSGEYDPNEDVPF